MKELDAHDPLQVSSATVLDADLGVGNRHLLVMSGIAIWDWVVDSENLAQGDVRVNLGVYARNLEHATAFVGLASFSNEESEFVFATDSARVELDAGTGELSLVVHGAVMGEKSALSRFGYQVVATIVRVGTSITGTITWPTTLMRPTADDPSLIAPHISVMANAYRLEPQPPPIVPMEALTPLVPGSILSVSAGAQTCTAAYRIDNPPMAERLKVSVTVRPSFTPGQSPLVARTAGPEVFTLNPGDPSERVDFALSTTEIL